jgi:hypothetical protein
MPLSFFLYPAIRRSRRAANIGYSRLFSGSCYHNDSVTKIERSVGLLAVLNMAMIAILLGRPHFSNASRAVRGITDPVLAMEVARNVAEVDAILSDVPSPDREVMRIKQYADFGFIACYATLFVLMSMLLRPRHIAITAGAFGVIAAVFDVIENLGTLRIIDVDLSHTTQAMIDAIRYPSLMKWALASLSLGSFGILLLRNPRLGLRIVGALNVLAALCGLLGLFDNRFLAWTGPGMLAGFLGLALLYFRPF